MFNTGTISLSEIKTPPVWAKREVEYMFLFGSREMSLRSSSKNFDTSEIRDLITESTDYDYAAQYSKKLCDRLNRSGWSKIPDEKLYHKCRLLESIWQKKKNDQTVQIMLRNNHDLFVRAWNSIDPEFYYRYIWKSSPEFTWRESELYEQRKHIGQMMEQIYKIIHSEYMYDESI